jgi:hypothetical protein
MRILLATEGPSDEVVAEQLIRNDLGAVSIDRKRFPARGFSVVERLIDVFVRAGQFGHYDLLVVHFDLDDTLPRNFTSLSQSKRWTGIQTRIIDTLASLPSANRLIPLKTLLMTPCRATEAWLAWGREGGSGRTWENADRRDLKRRLFGDPPRQLVEKSHVLASELIAQMGGNEDWPMTLKTFVDDLRKLRDSLRNTDQSA